jgi:hypothetical protein
VNERVYFSTDVEKSIKRILSRLNLIRSGISRNIIANDGTKILVHTRLQTLFNLKFKSSLDMTIYELMLTHALASEKMVPGGFDMCIERLLEKLSYSNDGTMPSTLKDRVGDILKEGSKPPMSADIDWIISSYAAENNIARNVLLEAIPLAGFAGKIIIEKSVAGMASVELIRGYTFNYVSAFPLICRFENPRVVCIDGLIESVSEIHHLLESASSAKEPMIMFVRGLSDDVLHTLKVNYDRGSLKVVPVLVRFDLNGMNTLNDIVVASGGDLISSLKGDLISSIKFHELPRVENMMFHQNKIVIVNRCTRKNVDLHVQELRKKRANEKVDDVSTLIDSRIKSLSPNHVVIRLIDDKNFIVTSQTIDYTLRAIRELIDRGSILKNGKQMLTTALFAAEIHSHKCVEMISNLGAVII